MTLRVNNLIGFGGRRPFKPLEISSAKYDTSGSDNSPKYQVVNLATPGAGQKLYLLVVCAVDATGSHSSCTLNGGGHSGGSIIKQYSTGSERVGFSLIEVDSGSWGTSQGCHYYHGSSGVNVGIQCFNIIADERADLLTNLWADYAEATGSNPTVTCPAGGAVFAGGWKDSTTNSQFGSFVNTIKNWIYVDGDYWNSGAEAHATETTGNTGLSSPGLVAIMAFGPRGNS